ncbi:lasso peptide biosynthesis B2 protein [Sphingomonas sp. CCH9-H8]|nr:MULTISPECIES: lasso peptide biosynthesis B2 protein [unclassified Sphingomonas]
MAWPACERRALGFAVVALPMAEIMLRLLGYRRSRRLFESTVADRPRTQAIDPVRADQIVRFAARFTIGNDRKCLRRSLVLAHILRANGYPVTVYMGWRKNAKDMLEGHAWCDLVEGAGAPQSREGEGYIRLH